MITPLTRVPLATNRPHLSTSHLFLFHFIFSLPYLLPRSSPRRTPAASRARPPATGQPLAAGLLAGGRRTRDPEDSRSNLRGSRPAAARPCRRIPAFSPPAPDPRPPARLRARACRPPAAAGEGRGRRWRSARASGAPAAAAAGRGRGSQDRRAGERAAAGAARGSACGRAPPWRLLPSRRKLLPSRP